MKTNIDKIRRLKKLQMVTGGIFSFFVLIHISNILTAPFGAENFNQFQTLTRQFYQYPIVEIFLIFVPLVTHLICAISLFFLQKRSPKRPLLQRLHSYTGIFLLLVIFGHIFAVRAPSFFYDIYPKFEGLSFTLWFFPAYFYPYYFLLAMAGIYHTSNSILSILRLRKITTIQRIPTTLLTVFGLFVIISLLAFGGELFGIANPVENDYAKLYGEFLDLDISKPFFAN